MDLIQKNFGIISKSTLTVIGLLGNSFVFYILTRPKFFKKSIYRYMIFETILNTLLVIGAWIYNYPDIFFNSSLTACKSIIYLSLSIYRLSPWIIALTAIDRYLSVKYPRKFEFRNKFKFQALAIFLVTLAIGLAGTPNILNRTLDLNQTRCITINQKTQIIMNIVNILLAVLLPILIMSISTSLIYHQLKIQKKNLNSNNLRKESRLCKVLFSISLFYFICNLPYSVVTLINNLSALPIVGTFSFDIVLFISAIYPSCDFFIYFFTNKLFRSYFLSMIRYGKD
jgi:hypothetical protein